MTGKSCLMSGYDVWVGLFQGCVTLGKSLKLLGKCIMILVKGLLEVNVGLHICVFKSSNAAQMFDIPITYV